MSGDSLLGTLPETADSALRASSWATLAVVLSVELVTGMAEESDIVIRVCVCVGVVVSGWSEV